MKNNLAESLAKAKKKIENVYEEKGNRTNVNVGDGDIIQALRNSWEGSGDKKRAIAETVMELIGDSPSNINFHIKLAGYIPPEQLIECAKISVEAGRQGQVRSSVPKYFVGVLKKKGLL